MTDCVVYNCGCAPGTEPDDCIHYELPERVDAQPYQQPIAMVAVGYQPGVHG